MTTVVPVAVYGREPKVHIAVNEGLLPEYDVVHSCTDLPSAKAELPALCSGDTSISPSSGIGSNLNLPASQRKIPMFIMIGSAIPDSDVKEVTQAIKEKTSSVGILRVSKEDMRKAGATGPDIGLIVKVFKEKLANEL